MRLEETQFEKMQDNIFTLFENIHTLSDTFIEEEMFLSNVKQTIENIEEQLTGIKESIKSFEKQF